MASPTQWTWVWASSGRWWRTGKPGVLQSMESQGVRQDWTTEVNWFFRMLHLSIKFYYSRGECSHAEWSSEFFKSLVYLPWGLVGSSVVKNVPANAGDAGSVPGLERSPGVGNGNPLQYLCLESPMDIEAWWPTVHRVKKSPMWLSEWARVTYYESQIQFLFHSFFLSV